MGQVNSATVQEEQMHKRINQHMGTLQQFGQHIDQANEWAKLCRTPKTCHLSFRMVIKKRLTPDLLPLVWRIRGNVFVEVRKLRRRQVMLPTTDNLDSFRIGGLLDADRAGEPIGRAKILSVRQFYYVYCFLSDVKAFAVQAAQPGRDANEQEEFDECECQICMDKQKQVVLPCTHSFCLNCFQHWSAQNKTCPICRAAIRCSEGEELWHLTSNEIDDIDAYATDLVSRVYEFLEKRDVSEFSEDDIAQSRDLYDAALIQKQAATLFGVHSPFSSFVGPELFPFARASAYWQRMRTNEEENEVDDDFMLALEVASGEDQVAALQHFEQLRQDHLLAMSLAMDGRDEDPSESR